MLHLYGDNLSQPARAIWILAAIEQDRIGPWKRAEIKLSKNEHKTEDFLKMHPGGKVPVMVDETKKDLQNKSLVLFESHAIMKYIC